MAHSRHHHLLALLHRTFMHGSRVDLPLYCGAESFLRNAYSSASFPSGHWLCPHLRAGTTNMQCKRPQQYQPMQAGVQTSCPGRRSAHGGQPVPRPGRLTLLPPHDWCPQVRIPTWLVSWHVSFGVGLHTTGAALHAESSFIFGATYCNHTFSQAG